MTPAQTIGNTILQQLGGNKFRAMTGAKDFIAGQTKEGLYYLQFSLPGRLAKNGINRVKIVLNGSDLYNVKFSTIRKQRCGFDYLETVKSESSDVYAEDLQDVFEHSTGLYTHL